MNIKHPETGKIINFNNYIASVNYETGDVTVRLYKDNSQAGIITLLQRWHDDDILDYLLSLEIKEYYIWEVSCFDKGYDTYNGFVVIATDEKQIKQIIKDEFGTKNIGDFKKIGIPTKENRKAKVVLDSFHAG